MNLLGTHRRARVWTLMGVLAALCGLFLAFGTGPTPATRRGLKVVLLDASMSVARGSLRHGRLVLRDLLDEANRAQEQGLEIAVLKFARDVEVLVPASEPTALAQRLLQPGRVPLAFDFSRGRDQHTSLAHAMELALQLLQEEGRARGEVVLLGDGLATGADPRPGLTRVLAAGHHFRRRPVGGGARVNLSLLGMEGATRVPEGRQLEVRLLLAGTGPLKSIEVPAQVILEVQDAEGTSVQKLEIPKDRWQGIAGSGSLGSGKLKQTLLATVGPLAPGTFRIEARCQAPGDLIAEDDSGVLTGVVGDGQVALLVAPRGGRMFDSDWVQTLADQGFIPHVTGVSEFSPQLDSAALLVTLDLAPRQLNSPSLEAFLRAGGVWLLMGEGSVMAGVHNQPTQSGLERHLPLIPARDEGGPRDVVLVVDGSGSMVGRPWQQVQAAVVQLGRGLLASDGLVLHVFTTRLPEPILSVAPGNAEYLARALSALLDTHLPGGATDVAYALGQLVKARQVAERRSLCILITDGHSSQGGRPSPSLRDDLTAVRGELAVIAVEGGGRKADRVALGGLLRPGETLRVAEDLTGLDSLLEELVQGEREIGPFESTQLAGELAPQMDLNPGTLRILNGFLERWSSQASPALEGAWRAQANLGAQVLLRAPSGEPLLASKDVAQGQVLVFASTPWAPAASEWEQHGLLGDLLGTLARDSNHNSVQLVRGRDGLLLVGELTDLERPLHVRWSRAGVVDSLGQKGPEKFLDSLPLAPHLGDPGGPLGLPWPGTHGIHGRGLLLARVLDRNRQDVAQKWVASPLPPDLRPPPWPRLGSADGHRAGPMGSSHPWAWVFLALALLFWTLGGWAQPRA